MPIAKATEAATAAAEAVVQWYATTLELDADASVICAQRISRREPAVRLHASVMLNGHRLRTDRSKEAARTMEHILATWGYLALFVIAAIAALGIPVGSEIVIAYAGVLASGQNVVGRHDHLELVIVIVVAALGEVTGSLVGYAIGRSGGRSLIDGVGKYALLTHKDLDRAEGWFARRGEPFVFFGRFVPFVRSFVSIAAGVGEMSIATFVTFTLAACILWCGMLAEIGFALGSSWHHIVTAFGYVGYLAASVVVLLALTFIVHRIRQIRLERATSSDDGG
jgi:membrane protein DedA with SNARE-associated domain